MVRVLNVVNLDSPRVQEAVSDAYRYRVASESEDPLEGERRDVERAA